MANIDAPNGMKPVRHLDGSSWNQQLEKYIIPATDVTATFVGDPAMTLAGASAAGIPYCKKAAVGAKLLGIIIGFEPEVGKLDVNHRLASTERVALVCVDPSVIYEVQEDSVGGALAAADVMKFADLTAIAGSTQTGNSLVELDSSTKVATTAQVRILRLSQRPDNVIGDNAKWEVIINESEFRANLLAATA